MIVSHLLIRHILVFLVMIVVTASADRCAGKPEQTNVDFRLTVHTAYKTDVDIECSKYIQCVNGTEKLLRKCPKPYLFNARTQRCDWSKNVECYVGCEGRNAGDVVAHPRSCNAYYECVANENEDGLLTAKLVTCDSSDQIFNPYKNATDKCASRNEWWCPLEEDYPSCSKLADGIPIFDPNNNSNYYICLKGALVLQSCPYGRYYDYNSQSCVSASPFKSENIEINSGIDIDYNDSPNVEEMCKGNKSKGLPDPHLCTAYTYCMNENMPIYMFCTENIPYFNQGFCSQHLSDMCTCELRTVGEMVKHNVNENEYWECTREGPMKRTCPIGYIFSKGFCREGRLD